MHNEAMRGAEIVPRRAFYMAANGSITISFVIKPTTSGTKFLNTGLLTVTV
jgi:hypothetical protein